MTQRTETRLRRLADASKQMDRCMTQRDKLIALLVRDGLSVRYIAQHCNVSYAQVSRIATAWERGQ